MFLGHSVYWILIDSSGGNDQDVQKRIELACIAWKPSISVSGIPVYLCQPMYTTALWSCMMLVSGVWQWHQKRLDAFEQWCIQHILPIPCTAHVSNSEVRSRTGQPPITTLIEQRRLKLFCHVARADQAEDHNRALRASLNPPGNWRRPPGRPRQTWLPTISSQPTW